MSDTQFWGRTMAVRGQENIFLSISGSQYVALGIAKIWKMARRIMFSWQKINFE